LTLLDDALTLEFWDMTFRVSSNTFVQTNYRQMLVLYRAALDMLAPRREEKILDLYAGIGTLSVAVAREAAAVTAIEENPHAVQLGRLNARINFGLRRATPGKVESALREVRLGKYSAAILDPPRAGCEPGGDRGSSSGWAWTASST
jgi:23S rRNA (uracil1939-C5)-methyltransferase